MIGAKTGNVIGYTVRSKQCRVCSSSARNNTECPPHDCRRNWDGSAKGMEADMVAEIVTDISSKGIRTKAIIGDDDSTTIARLKSTIDKNITKRSDKNHLKKTISNSLFALQKHHQSLTTKVIRYLLKCFSYVIEQNKGNEEGICKGLEALSKHPFGDHSDCNDSWCRMLSKKDSRHSSLPYGRPLTDMKLKQALETLFRSFLKHAGKLSNLGSTQGNESLNKTIASKAPKSNHYSGSASLNFRVAASIAQKNMGQSYLLAVSVKVNCLNYFVFICLS